MMVFAVIVLIVAIALFIITEFFEKKAGEERMFRTGGLFLLFIILLTVYVGCIRPSGESEDVLPVESDTETHDAIEEDVEETNKEWL